MDVLRIFLTQMLLFVVIGFIWWDYIRDWVDVYFMLCVVASLFMSPPSIGSQGEKAWLPAMRAFLGERNGRVSFWFCVVHDCFIDPSSFYYILYLTFAALGATIPLGAPLAMHLMGI